MAATCGGKVRTRDESANVSDGKFTPVMYRRTRKKNARGSSVGQGTSMYSFDAQVLSMRGNMY